MELASSSKKSLSFAVCESSLTKSFLGSLLQELGEGTYDKFVIRVVKLVHADVCVQPALSLRLTALCDIAGFSQSKQFKTNGILCSNNGVPTNTLLDWHLNLNVTIPLSIQPRNIRRIYVYNILWGLFAALCSSHPEHQRAYGYFILINYQLSIISKYYRTRCRTLKMSQ